MSAKRTRASSRREEILNTTVDLVCEVGHQQVRVADVAARLGVSPSLIIYHFHTKDELVAQAFRFAAQNDLVSAQRVVRQESDPVQRIIALMRWYAPSERSQSWNLWIDGWAAGMWNESLAQTLNEIDREWKQLLATAITEGIEQGKIASTDPWNLAVRLTAFADGLAVTRVARTADIPVKTISEWVSGFIEHELRMLDNEEPIT